MKSLITIIILAALAFGGYHLTQQQPDVLEEPTTTQALTMNARITTTEGVIELELFNNLAPKTVENFVSLAESDFYTGVKFHRVIKGFMIQGGDPLTKDEDQVDFWGTGGPGYQFEDEIHAENNNLAGTISMANAGPNTNGSQFFINTADNSFLDPKHTVFGKVVSGMEVVTAIESVDTFPNDRPIQHVEIQSIEIIK
jgi:cyclophilin family peptidyl-prolyl cis-trans isomerase